MTSITVVEAKLDFDDNEEPILQFTNHPEDCLCGHGGIGNPNTTKRYINVSDMYQCIFNKAASLIMIHVRHMMFRQDELPISVSVPVDAVEKQDTTQIEFYSS